MECPADGQVLATPASSRAPRSSACSRHRRPPRCAPATAAMRPATARHPGCRPPPGCNGCAPAPARAQARAPAANRPAAAARSYSRILPLSVPEMSAAAASILAGSGWNSPGSTNSALSSCSLDNACNSLRCLAAARSRSMTMPVASAPNSATRRSQLLGSRASARHRKKEPTALPPAPAPDASGRRGYRCPGTARATVRPIGPRIGRRGSSRAYPGEWPRRRCRSAPRQSATPRSQRQKPRKVRRIALGHCVAILVGQQHAGTHPRRQPAGRIGQRIQAFAQWRTRGNHQQGLALRFFQLGSSYGRVHWRFPVGRQRTGLAGSRVQENRSAQPLVSVSARPGKNGRAQSGAQARSSMPQYA